jgi:tetratricopeptide (TPR) repeat protein
MEEELKDAESDLDALRSEAGRLFDKKEYQQALDCYLKLYDFIPNDLNVVYKITICYLYLENYKIAIKYCDQIIERLINESNIDKDYLCDFYFFRGFAYCFIANSVLGSKEDDYKKAIDDFLESLKINSEDKNVNWFVGNCYLKLDDEHNAVEYFIKSKTDVLEILRSYNNTGIVSLMLDTEIEDKDNPTLFSKAISDGGIEDITSNEYKAYRDIYIKVLEIIALLHVNNENEKLVAHYTRISTAEQLVFNDSPFRLNTILTANDPKEGLDLFEFLNLKETDNNVSSDFQAFIGSFTFNHDSLNQFRLYGKEDDKEATGISLVFNEDFFNGEIAGSVKNCCGTDDKKIDDGSSDKKSLFRCIYVDPVSQQLISIGQREVWTFYRENKKNIKRADRLIKRYKKETDILFKFVKDKLNELKFLIDDLGENKKINVLSELLLILRYLTKNMAFKEEQECRVMTIENITKNPNILPKKECKDFSQMYIEYQTVKDCIEKVYFAPKAKGKEMFNIQINRFGLNIRSHESTHKIS